MARTLSKYTFRQDRKGRGRPALYPWAEWSNGLVYEATSGIDFTNKPESFRSTLRAHASRNNLSVKVDIIDAKTKTPKVVFQFLKKPAISKGTTMPAPKRRTKKRTIRK